MTYRLFLNKNTLLSLIVLALCGSCEAQCIPNCCNEEWGTVSVGISAVKPGGINSLPIAVTENSEDSDGWEGKLYTVSFDWSPAWEVEVSKNLCGGGTLGLQYWGTHADDSFSVSDSENGLYLIFSSGESDQATDLSKVSARVKLNATKVAINYTDLLTCSCNTQVQWCAGLTFYYFDSFVKAKGFQNGTLEQFTQNDDTNYLIGPTTGILFKYFFNRCFDLYLNTNVTVSYNLHDIKRVEGPINELDSPIDIHYEYSTVLPVVESALGFTLSMCNWDISVEYGFKWFYHLFDSTQQLDDTNEGAGLATPHDVSFHGVTLRVGRAF